MAAPKGLVGFFCTKGFFLQKIWGPKLSNGESVKYAFLSNFPLVKNLCEKEFSGVWLSWVMLGWDQGPNLT